MKQIVEEWIRKAENDFITAQRGYRPKKFPDYDDTCFHSQQCVEKYMKALLQKHDIPFGKSHDLSVLLDLLLPCYPLWETYREGLNYLSSFAVNFRYPGYSADKATAKAALDICKRVRKAARMELGFENSK